MLYGPNQGGRGRSVFMNFPRETPASLSDSIGTNDSLSAAIEITLSDSIGFQGTIAEKTLLFIEDSIVFSELPVSLSVKALTLSYSIGLSESILASISVSFSDSVGFQESPSAHAIIIGLLSASIGFQDAPVSTSILLVSLSDSIGFIEIPVSGATQRIVVFSAETGAATTYEFPFGISGVGVWNKTVYLTTPQGLYALDAETDNGSAVTWEFRSGFSDFGSNMLKRIYDVSVLAHGGTSATLVLVTGSSAGKNEYNYPAPVWGAPASFGYIIKAGRGLKSVHYQFGLSGVGRANISAVKPTVELLSRRR